MLGKEKLIQNKNEFPEEWRNLLNYFINERDKLGWTTKKVIEITGKSSASHYFTESQFLIPTEEHYKKLQSAADGKAFNENFINLKKGANNILDKMKKSRAYFNNTHDNFNNVWHFDRHKRKGDEGGHATPKPIPLCERVIKSSCPENGIVIDMFLGSGSTLIAAEKLNRKCYGMELDEKYCDVIIERWEQFTGLKAKKIN